MLSKVILTLITSTLLTTAFAAEPEAVQTAAVNSEPVNSIGPDRCFYSSDQFQFNGVHVSPNGSTSYVINSFVTYYSHDGKDVPADLYKGRLALEDEDGMTYEICIRGGDPAALEKLEMAHGSRTED